MTRLPWPDLAKAVCIVLVVMHHAILFLLAPFSATHAESWWFVIDGILTPLRIPLFFLVSGLLAHNAIQRPWSASVSSRISRLYRIYASWLVIAALTFLVIGNAPDKFGTWKWLPINLAIANSAMWYLYALIVYFVVAKLLRRQVVLTLVAAAILSTTSGLFMPEDLRNPTALLRNLIFFLVGAYVPELIGCFARQNRRWQAWTAAAAYVTLAAVAVKYDASERISFGASFALSVFAIPAGIMFASWAARSRVVSRCGGWLGARTLPIYVLHMPLISVLVLLAERADPLSLPVGLVLPVASTFLLVLVSLVVFAVTDRWLPWLYSPRARGARRSDPPTLEGANA